MVDEQTRLLTEIRDLLLAEKIRDENWLDEYRAANQGIIQRLIECHQSVTSTRLALWVIGAIEVAVVVWILSRAGG